MKSRRRVKLGREAWMLGELDRAVELLEAALAERPGSLDAILPLARTLSERDEPEKALSLLAGATTGSHGDACRLFRAIILYDHGRSAEATEALSSLDRENIIAKALEALLQFRGSTGESGPIVLPPGARWISEVAGRILALVEERLHRSDAAAALALHHSFFSPRAEACKSPIEEAFAAQRHAEVEQLLSSEALSERKTRDSDGIFLAFALVALGRDQDTLRAITRARRERPASPDLHFIEGLCHSRFGRVREAGWSFVRASRLADTDVDQILFEVAGRAGIRIISGD